MWYNVQTLRREILLYITGNTETVTFPVLDSISIGSITVQDSDK